MKTNQSPTPNREKIEICRCKNPKVVWEFRGYYCDGCGKKIHQNDKKQTLLDKAIQGVNTFIEEL